MQSISVNSDYDLVQQVVGDQLNLFSDSNRVVRVDIDENSVGDELEPSAIINIIRPNGTKSTLIVHLANDGGDILIDVQTQGSRISLFQRIEVGR